MANEWPFDSLGSALASQRRRSQRLFMIEAEVRAAAWFLVDYSDAPLANQPVHV